MYMSETKPLTFSYNFLKVFKQYNVSYVLTYELKQKPLFRYWHIHTFKDNILDFYFTFCRKTHTHMFYKSNFTI